MSFSEKTFYRGQTPVITPGQIVLIFAWIEKITKSE
jgi:hypothetical protein